MVTGLATPDDLAALEDCQFGVAGRAARWNEVERGMGEATVGPDAAAEALGAQPVTSTDDWSHETLYHGFYRRWAEMMSTELGD